MIKINQNKSKWIKIDPDRITEIYVCEQKMCLVFYVVSFVNHHAVYTMEMDIYYLSISIYIYIYIYTS
jgi:hypothetical protein